MKTKRNTGLLRYLSFCVNHAPVWGSLYLALNFLNALMPTVKMAALALLVDSLVSSAEKSGIPSDVYVCAAAFIAVLLVEFLLNSITSYVSGRLKIRMGEMHDVVLTDKRSRIKYALVEDHDVSDLYARVSDDCTDKMYTGFSNLVLAGSYVIRILGIVGMVMLSSIPVGLVCLGLLTMIIPVAVKAGEEDYNAYAQASARKRRARYLRDVLSKREYAHERTLYGFTEWVNNKWEAWFEEGRNLNKAATKKNFIHIKTGSVCTVTFVGIIALLLLVLLRDGDMSAGVYISVLTTVINFTQLMTWNVSYVVEELVTGREYMADYVKFIELEEDSDQQDPEENVRKTEDSVAGDIFHGADEIHFENVSFTYPGTTRKVLDGVSFQLKKGKLYALVGENGSGKSTVVKLLLGLYDNYEGRILVDGTELKCLSYEQRTKLFACAFQNFARYEMSLKENITVGCDEWTQKEVENLISVLGLEDTVKGLSDGMDTELGRLSASGVDLSGGQWQRIAIARTLVRKAPVTIMDEPTAALDPTHERDIYQVICGMMKNCIGLMISHRLGSITEVDEILVIHDGRVREQGTFRELILANGLFAQMYETQRSWYL